MAAYYNERDPKAAEWLRNLIAAGHIAPGEVDGRSITEVSPNDLKGFIQCHFFAGIGVWSHALRRSGWSDDRPVWTGSCPCQPFSAAGQQKGFADERHLWPVWFKLIEQCRPAAVLGEQVASALTWFDLVSADLERASYACAASDLCAAGFDGAHIRQRLYFVAVGDTDHARLERRRGVQQRANLRFAGEASVAGRVDYTASARSVRAQRAPEVDPRNETRLCLPSAGCGDGGLADAAGGHPGAEQQQRSGQHGLQPQIILPVRSGDCGGKRGGDGGLARPPAPMLGRTAVDWLFCRDGKWRPVDPGTFPLVDAAPARVGRLRAYGNALDAETATEFCGAVIDALADMAG